MKTLLRACSRRLGQVYVRGQELTDTMAVAGAFLAAAGSLILTVSVGVVVFGSPPPAGSCRCVKDLYGYMSQSSWEESPAHASYSRVVHCIVTRPGVVFRTGALHNVSKVIDAGANLIIVRLLKITVVFFTLVALVFGLGNGWQVRPRTYLFAQCTCLH